MNDDQMKMVTGALDRFEAPHIAELKRIGAAIGYGRSCQVLGDLWDDMLERDWQMPRGRGAMERRRDIETIEAKLKALAGPPLPDGAARLPCALMIDPEHAQYGWLFVPHVDNKWVSLVKLDPFSGAIVEYWRAATGEPAR